MGRRALRGLCGKLTGSCARKKASDRLDDRLGQFVTSLGAPDVCFTFNNSHSTIEGCADCRLYLEARSRERSGSKAERPGSELNQRRVKPQREFMGPDTTRNFEGPWEAAACRLFGRAFSATTLTYAGSRSLHKTRLCLPFLTFKVSFGERQGSASERGRNFNPRIRCVGC